MLQNQPLTFGDLSVAVVVSPAPWHENCYVVRHRPSNTQLIADPGGTVEAILAETAAGGGGATAMLLTHGHFDHLGAAKPVQTALNLVCHAHADEEPIISGASRLAAAWGREKIDNPEPVEYFQGEPTLRFGEIAVRVVHTPGHTPGGVCYVFDGFALTGDTLFNQGIGRTDLPGGNGPKLMSSITRFLGDVPDDMVLFAGHGPEWTAGEAKRWWKWMVAHG